MVCGVIFTASRPLFAYFLQVERRCLRLLNGRVGSAGDIAAAMELMEVWLSSVSASSRWGGMLRMASGLNFSPSDRYMPRDVIWRAVSALPLNPWIIHGLLGRCSLCRRSIMSRALTQ